MKKKLLVIITLILTIFSGVQAQSTITIGEGTSSNKLPMFCYFSYSYSQTIYLQSEIGSPMTISKIAFNYKGNDWSQEMTVLLGHSDKTKFSATDDWVAKDNLTQVFNGTVSVVAGWVEITLDTPFAYNGTQNLIVAVDENSEDFQSESDYFYGSNKIDNRGLVKYSGFTNIDPAAPPIGKLVAGIANIKLFPPAETPHFVMTPLSNNFGQRQINTVSTAKEFKLKNDGSGAVTLSSVALQGADKDQFVLTENNTYPCVLNAGQSVVVTVQFAPTALGNKSASLKITGDYKAEHEALLTGAAFDAVINSLPYSENFDTPAFLTSGWNNLQVSGDGLWEAVQSGTSPICTPYNGNGMVKFNCYNYASGVSALLAMPRINADLTNYQLSFWMYRDESGGNLFNDSLNIWANNSDNLEGAELLGTIHRKIGQSPVTTTSGWSQYTFDLPLKKYLLFNAVSCNGYNIYLDDVSIKPATGIANAENQINPNLISNYPNPFNPETTINLNLNSPAKVKLTVFNAAGKVVGELINENRTAGHHNVKFNANHLNSGVYFYQLQTGSTSVTQKMILLK